MHSTRNELATETALARVWLVDDSRLEATIGQRGLGTLGVVVFDDGTSMLDRLEREKALPDIIVLDWHMPNMSGLEACRAVRARFDSAQLPILILRASGAHEDLVEALHAGANDFLRKPFAAAELSARVSALVRVKRLHEDLGRVERALREQANFREQLLAIVAHDLRQPLNVFSLATEAVASPATPPDVRARIGTSMSRAAERMERMIGQLLDFTRARPAAGIPVRLRATCLDSVAREVVEQIRLEHPFREISYHVDGPCTGTWDADRLAQVVSNLVENALANSPADSPVALRVRACEGRIELAVENRGSTIPPELLANIFEPLRERRPQTRRGLGLGLFIVAEIVRAHGGTVAAASADGVTMFAVSLPRTEPS